MEAVELDIEFEIDHWYCHIYVYGHIGFPKMWIANSDIIEIPYQRYIYREDLGDFQSEACTICPHLCEKDSLSSFRNRPKENE